MWLQASDTLTRRWRRVGKGNGERDAQGPVTCNIVGAHKCMESKKEEMRRNKMLPQQPRALAGYLRDGSG